MKSAFENKYLLHCCLSIAGILANKLLEEMNIVNQREIISLPLKQFLLQRLAESAGADPVTTSWQQQEQVIRVPLVELPLTNTDQQVDTSMLFYSSLCLITHPPWLASLSPTQLGDLGQTSSAFIIRVFENAEIQSFSLLPLSFKSTSLSH